VGEGIAIGLEETADAFRQRLEAALQPVRARGAAPTLSEVRRGRWVFLHCALGAGDAEAAADFRRALLQVLTEWIVGEREAAWLHRLAATHYPYFRPEERQAIVALARRQLDPGDGERERRRERVRRRLGEYLERSATLVVEGFITFRLKDYVAELAAAVDRAVEEFLLEREYREFLELLRHVVQSRADRPAVAHCLVDGERRFRIQDDAGRPVAGELWADPGPAAGRELGPEDVLLSALITLAPREVCLHLPPEAATALSPEALATLEAVFPRAVTLCRGCARCGQRAEG
jgi:putative sporulation protein YtxC